MTKVFVEQPLASPGSAKHCQSPYLPIPKGRVQKIYIKNIKKIIMNKIYAVVELVGEGSVINGASTSN